MSEILSKMQENLQLRNYSPCTNKAYLWHVKAFQNFYSKSVDELGEAEIRKYLLYVRSNFSLSQMKQAVGALRFSSCCNAPVRTLELDPRLLIYQMPTPITAWNTT